MAQKREVARFTFQDEDWMTARTQLFPYRSEIGTFDLIYTGPPLPESADVEIPTIITELYEFIGQGQNFDVTVYETSTNPSKYQIDITKAWR